MILTENEYGFTWGPLTLNRICHDERKGWCILNAHSTKHKVQIYCTKTGKIRVFMDGAEMKRQEVQSDE